MHCYLHTLLQRHTQTPTAPTWSCTAFSVQLQVIPRKATTFPGYWAESKAELATSTIIGWWTAYKKQLGDDAISLKTTIIYQNIEVNQVYADF